MWLDPTKSVDERVNALLARLTTQQKIAQLGSDAVQAGIPSLGVPGFDWQAECLHGMVNQGLGVMYPQPVAWAATFDTALTSKVSWSAAAGGK